MLFVRKVNGIGVERHLAYIKAIILYMSAIVDAIHGIYKLNIIIVERMYTYKMNALKRLSNFTG